MSTVLPSPEVQATGCEALLRRLCDDYYEGCKAYAATADRHHPDNPQRVFHRIRLGVLQRVGADLAAALGWAEPEWEAMRHLAEPEEQPW